MAIIPAVHLSPKTAWKMAKNARLLVWLAGIDNFL
jgi:hypothetical protein